MRRLPEVRGAGLAETARRTRCEGAPLLRLGRHRPRRPGAGSPSANDPVQPHHGELAYCRCFSTGRAPLRALVRTAGSRWRVEATGQTAKGQPMVDDHPTSDEVDEVIDPSGSPPTCRCVSQGGAGVSRSTAGVRAPLLRRARVDPFRWTSRNGLLETPRGTCGDLWPAWSSPWSAGYGCRVCVQGTVWSGWVTSLQTGAAGPCWNRSVMGVARAGTSRRDAAGSCLAAALRASMRFSMPAGFTNRAQGAGADW